MMEERVRKNYLTEVLSDETLVHILQFVKSHADFVHLSLTCKRLNHLLRDKQFCSNVAFPWYLGLSRGSVTRFLKDRPRAEVIRKLDMSDLYWIPSGILRDLVSNMINLETLLAAGTRLSWVHLSQVLQSLSIKRLSWSWDNALEESCRRRSSISPTKFAELMEMKETFLKLTALLIHIPMMSKTATDVLFYSYSALEYMVSLCKNLEELWLLSWPKTPAERKSSSSSYNRRNLDDLGLTFDKLHTLVVSVKGPPRFSPMSFFSKLVKTFGILTPVKVFYLDHPLLGIRSMFSNSEDFPLGNGLLGCVMPQLCSETATRLSYPIVAMMESAKERFNYPELKHVLVCHGQPVVVNLNGIFDNSPALESFYCSTFNFKLDWKKFVDNHPKLKAISVSETHGLEDNCDCIAFSKLDDLRHLSVPSDCLCEIRDAKLLSEYLIMQCTCTSGDASADPSPAKLTGSETLNKKGRVGASTKPLSEAKSVAGLNYVALACSRLQELEIGYGDSSHAKPGKFSPDALFCISKFKLLTKLSLSSLPIYSGKFLVQILNECDIESLRLTHLGPAAKCCYVPDLCEALKSARVLQDFRLEQNYIGTPFPILNALQSCRNLRRVLIWSSPNDKSLEFDPVDSLFAMCSKLTMFYATIEGTTKSDCFKIRKALEAKYKAERPALSIILRRTLEEEELIQYPSVHYRQMVMNGPQVCQFTDFLSFNNNCD